MARTGKNKLRGWEYPAGSGIRVREIINRYEGNDGGISYRVTIPTRIAGARQFKQFGAVDAAESWAKVQFAAFRQEGQRHFTLSAAQREDAGAALEILASTALTLKAAAEFAKKHHVLPNGDLTVQKVIEKLLAEKEAENLRERSVRDLAA